MAERKLRLRLPPPPPPPTPPPVQPPVRIFANPAPVEYASVGASVAGPGGNLDTYDSKTATFGPISTNDGDQAHIRYNAGGYYEIELPGAGWDQLVHYKGIVGPTSDNNYFQPQDVAMNLAYLVTTNARDKGFSYSELGGWGSVRGVALGLRRVRRSDPRRRSPNDGLRNLSGLFASGSTDIMVADNLYGGYFPLNVDGTVELNFNFGAGTLGGSMTLSLPDGMKSRGDRDLGVPRHGLFRRKHDLFGELRHDCPWPELLPRKIHRPVR